MVVLKKENLYSKLEARNAEQKWYLKAIWQNDIIFCTGRAGTGKTHIAIGKAINELAAGTINKIVLVRPAVESSVSIGYLPGDMSEKMMPFIRPLYDELEYYISRKDLEKLTEEGIIEIVPLGMMRGRTLKNAYVILDEAQNATYKELKLFLTRIGSNSKMIITGDLGQSDIPDTGLWSIIERLEDLEGVEHVVLTEILRNPIIERILERL